MLSPKSLRGMTGLLLPFTVANLDWNEKIIWQKVEEFFFSDNKTSALRRRSASEFAFQTTITKLWPNNNSAVLT